MVIFVNAPFCWAYDSYTNTYQSNNRYRPGGSSGRYGSSSGNGYTKSWYGNKGNSYSGYKASNVYNTISGSGSGKKLGDYGINSSYYGRELMKTKTYPSPDKYFHTGMDKPSYKGTSYDSNYSSKLDEIYKQNADVPVSKVIYHQNHETIQERKAREALRLERIKEARAAKKAKKEAKLKKVRERKEAKKKKRETIRRNKKISSLLNSLDRK